MSIKRKLILYERVPIFGMWDPCHFSFNKKYVVSCEMVVGAFTKPLKRHDCIQNDQNCPQNEVTAQQCNW